MANGEQGAAVNLHVMEASVDMGAVVDRRKVPLEDCRTEHALYRRCAELAAAILKDFLHGLPASTSRRGPAQPGIGSYCSLPTRDTVRRFYGRGYRFFRLGEFLGDGLPPWNPLTGFGVALVLTALALYLRWTHLTHAGGLWRDEAVSAFLATRSTFGETWDYLRFESFPGLLATTLRLWVAAGFGETDFGLRLFGFLVGVLILCALWLNARFVAQGLPLISLTLIGLNPIAVQTQDAVRAYGLGTLFILLTFNTVWKLMREHHPRWLYLSLASSILSVQSLYQNAFLLVAILGAALVVAWLEGSGSKAILVLAIGLTAAISLLPYVPIVRQVASSGDVVRIPEAFRTDALWSGLEKLAEGLASPSSVCLILWPALILLSVFMAWRRIRSFGASTEPSRKTVYALTVLVLAVPLFWVFLSFLDVAIQVWHYAPLIALLAVCLDVMLVPSDKGIYSLRTASGLSMVLAVLLFVQAIPGARLRHTNLDLIASRLNQVASEDDLVIVHPLYYGTSFQRYYRGKAPWLSLPPVADHGVQRPDLWMEQMSRPDPLHPVFERLQKTLVAGHRVWIVGDVYFPRPDEEVLRLPPAPRGPHGWYAGPYLQSWSIQLGQWIQSHARVQLLTPVYSGPVNPLENAAVIQIEG